MGSSLEMLKFAVDFALVFGSSTVVRSILLYSTPQMEEFLGSGTRLCRCHFISCSASLLLVPPFLEFLFPSRAADPISSVRRVFRDYRILDGINRSLLHPGLGQLPVEIPGANFDECLSMIRRSWVDAEFILGELGTNLGSDSVQCRTISGHSIFFSC